MNRAYLFVIAVLALSLIAPNPGHPASQVGPGTFASGDFTFPGQLTVDGNFIINTNTLFVDTTTERIGIGTTTPTQTLDVRGSINVSNTIITSELCLGGVCETVWPVATEGEPELIHELGPVGPASYLSGNGAIGRGDTAFVITESTVTIIDLKNSTGPNIAGSYSFSGTPRIEATNTHIFDERSGLIRILDIANPADPRVVGNITVSEDVQFMRATPTQLFVGGLNGTISIFDTSIPERPVFISNITDHGAQINGMAIQDNILYYTTFSEALGGYIIAVDITDPQNPVTLGNVSQTYIGGIIVSGPYAYVSNLANIRIYNIQDPTNMQLINTVNSPNGLHGTGEMRIRGEYLYRAYFINGDDEDLFIFDISNPENIEIAYRVEIGNTTGSGGGTSNILEINGRYLHVAKGVVENGGVFVKTYRLPGVDYTSANIGSIRVGSIHARENVHVRGTVDARGGLTAGDARIRTTGTVSAETVSTQSLRLDTQSARPDCELERRGTLWFEQREGSDDDRLFACMRNGTDAYNWVLVARGE